jgi:hypothetical protein
MASPDASAQITTTAAPSLNRDTNHSGGTFVKNTLNEESDLIPGSGIGNNRLTECGQGPHNDIRCFGSIAASGRKNEWVCALGFGLWNAFIPFASTILKGGSMSNAPDAAPSFSFTESGPRNR